MKSIPGIKLLALFCAALLWLPSLASADEFEDWMTQELGEFQKYQDERDKAFAEMLNKDWREFQMNFGLTRDPEPKPEVFPRAPEPSVLPPDKRPPEGKPQDRVKPRPLPKPPKPHQPLDKILKKRRFDGQALEVNFFGAVLAFNYDPRLKARLGRRMDKAAIGNFWKALSTSDYKPLLAQLTDDRDALRLNDWGYVQLVHKLGEAIYGGDENAQGLFDWFVLTKSGYSARVGFNDRRIYLMLPAKTQFYGTPYFKYDGRNYFVVSFSGRSEKVSTLYSYEGNYARADAVIDLAMARPPRLKPSPQERALKFRFEGERYRFSARYDRNLVNYLKVYPVTELDVYFRSRLSDELQYSLLSALRPMVDGKSEAQAVNLLLRFVQTAFEYKTDDAQFGREKYFFPEELFLYQYSDCEDRSVLFAYLVKNLLGLDVVALDYPGHVATAVRFKGKVAGSTVSYQGRRYVISDPTYINASAGMVMPRYKNTSPKVIAIPS